MPCSPGAARPGLAALATFRLLTPESPASAVLSTLLIGTGLLAPALAVPLIEHALAALHLV